jgi:hypothetical protein
MREERQRELGMWAGAILLYTATAVADFVLPLGRHFGKRLLGTALFAPDPILNAGILEWGYRSLWNPALRIFQWNAGFPLRDSLAVTENLIGWQLFYVPSRLLGGPVFSYNLCIVISFVLSGCGAALLARRLGADRSGAVVAGFIFAFVPFHLNHVIHIQTMAVCDVPFVLYFLDRYLARPSVIRALPLAAAYLLAALSSLYLGVFLFVLAPSYAILAAILGRYGVRSRAWGGLLAIALVSAVLLLPVVLPYRRFGAAHGYRHPVGTVARFSLEVLAIFKTPSWVAIWSHGPIPRRNDWTPAFPGVVASFLAFFFLFRRAADPDARRIKITLAVLGFGAFLFSLGPVLKIHAYDPIWSAAWLPLPGTLFRFFSEVRWPMRILLLAFLFGAIGCGLGFSQATKRLRPSTRWAAAAATIVLLFVEYRPRPAYAGASLLLPAPLAVSEAYPFLASESDGGGIVELPDINADGDRVPNLVRYVYGSSGHLRRVVAYHGSVLPSITLSLLDAAGNLPSETSCRFLVARGVTRVVIHNEAMFGDSEQPRRDEFLRAGYRALFQSAHAAVFSLENPCPVGVGPGR